MNIVSCQRVLAWILVAGVATTAAWAQSPPVPSIYQSLYSTLQSEVSAFDGTVNNQWDGSKPPVVFSADLLSANDNRGLTLIAPGTYGTVLLELDHLRSLGVQAVTVSIGFPLLYQPFYQFNGDPGDYQAMVDFYKQLSNDIHARGMKMIVESQFVFVGFFGPGVSFNVGGYYPTLSPNQLMAARAQDISVIASQVHPDYINLGSEPDTAAQIFGEATPTATEYSSATAALVSQLRAAGVTLPLGAGIGTWLAGGQDYVTGLCSTGINYLDLHVYYVNFGDLMQAIPLADAGRACGLNVAISEAWLFKEAPGENINSVIDPTIFSRDSFSFWQPLDEQFLLSLVKYSYWKKLLYFSPFWSRYFWAYLDYNQVQTLTSQQLIVQANKAAYSALQNSQVTATGSIYGASVQGLPRAATASAASFANGNMAPDSIVAIFGSNLATGTSVASSLPLPTSLSGATASILDSNGSTSPVPFFFASPAQINAAIPAGLSLGPALLTVSRSGTPVAQSIVTLSSVAPALFTVNENGKGAPAAVVVTQHPDLTQSVANVYQGSGVGSYVPAPISLGSAQDTVVLVLYGTGIRGRSSTGNVQVTIGNQSFGVQYAGPSDPTDFVALDQINVQMVPSLARSGLVNLTVTVDGVVSNTVTLDIE